MFCVFATKAWSIKKTKQILPWKNELLQLDAILLSLCAPHLLRSLCFSDPWWKSCCFKAFCNIWNCCYGVGSHKPQLLLFWVGFVAVVGCWTVDTLNNPGKTQCFRGFKSVFSNAQVCVWISGQREDTFVNRLSNSGLPNLLEITCCQVVCGCL